MQDKAHRALLAEAQASLREGRFDDAQSQANRLLEQGGDRGVVCEILAHAAAARGDILGAAAWRCGHPPAGLASGTKTGRQALPSGAKSGRASRGGSGGGHASLQ